jgi:5'-methylthioadenosine phosphorylase
MMDEIKEPVIGFIGGSGLYDIDGIEAANWVKVDTPYGNPSDKLLEGKLAGRKVIFLPRHGRNHTLLPSNINSQANIYALKSMGVSEIISLSACGSFDLSIKPGTFILVDQFIDLSNDRPNTFFEQGCVAHVSMANPTCNRLANSLRSTCERLSILYKKGGTYLVMEGPQFSTKAESLLYQSWGCNIIGMTNMPEAKLAREAEICYQTVGMVTDYDCWHPDYAAVTVDTVIGTLMANAHTAKSLIIDFMTHYISEQKVCYEGCQSALETALVTPKEDITPDLIRKLEPIISRLL